LVRNSIAPTFIASTDIAMSPWPVMKMIGIPRWAAQFALEIETAEPRQPDVEHEACRRVRPLESQKVLRRGRDLGPHPHRPE
jgi:hypothetical protein